MDRHIVVLTMDKRQEKLVRLLKGKKWCGDWVAYQNELLGVYDIKENIYVLPIPVSRLDQYPQFKEKLKRELITNKKMGRVKVFGGVINEEWQAFLQEQNIPCWDFMKLSEVVEGNAWITAEATVAEVLAHGRYSIKGQRVFVAGYGSCGSKIADVFARLGAEVIVAARREEVREQARQDGFLTTDFEKGPSFMYGTQTVINTVPAMVITEEYISRLRKDALVVDIASKPGGTDFDAAKRYGIRAKLALGLPGIYTTTSSAELLKNAISQYAPKEDDVREDRTWIFQIII